MPSRNPATIDELRPFSFGNDLSFDQQTKLVREMAAIHGRLQGILEQRYYLVRASGVWIAHLTWVAERDPFGKGLSKWEASSILARCSEMVELEQLDVVGEL